MRPFFLLLVTTVAFAQPVIGDIDGDGLLDIEEDINQNGIFDGGETDFQNADTDGGGEADGAEIKDGRDPFDQTDDLPFDRDGDGLSNGEELLMNTDPDHPDTDRDSVNDNVDPFPLERRFTKDDDDDGIADEWESLYQLSPIRKLDALIDIDGDGLVNIDEFIEGTNPLDPDTDRDGIVDSIEITEGSDPTESPCLLYTAPRYTFRDISSHWAETYITRLHRTKITPDHIRIVEGYKSNSALSANLQSTERLFLPNREISRFELLKMALLGSCIQLAKDKERLAFSFKDVPGHARPHETDETILRRRVIYTAVRHGIIDGYKDGTFKPHKPINRAEALKIFFLASQMDPPSNRLALPFLDVQPSDWFAKFIEQGIWYDIVEGYEDKTFKPNQPITRAEVAKILYLVMLNNPKLNGYVLPSEGI
jgi:hypothetical protein